MIVQGGILCVLFEKEYTNFYSFAKNVKKYQKTLDLVNGFWYISNALHKKQHE